jgi:hypothetical protein
MTRVSISMFLLFIFGCGSPSAHQPASKDSVKTKKKDSKEKLSNKRSTDEDLKIQWQQRSDRMSAEIAKKYGALVDWKVPLKTLEPVVYTLEIEDSLIKQERQPVLFIAKLDDVYRKDGKCYLKAISHTADYESINRVPDPNLIFECSVEQARKMMAESRSVDEMTGTPLFALVAFVETVGTFESAIHVDVKADFDESHSNASAAADADNRTVIVKGRIKDAVFLGSEPW